jgi:hypothetical protein
MQALPFDKDLTFFCFETIYHRPLLFRCISQFRKCVIALYIRNKIIVRHGASDLARSAANAPGCINEYPGKFFGTSCVVRLDVDVRDASGGNSSRSYEKLSSIHDMS